jgi:hypothetical protein
MRCVDHHVALKLQFQGGADALTNLVSGNLIENKAVVAPRCYPTDLMALPSEAAAQPEVEEVVSDGLTLDLTNSHLRTLVDVPLAPTLTVSMIWHVEQCHSSMLQVLCMAANTCTNMQALDLTANRLTGLEPSLLALTGDDLSLQPGVHQSTFPWQPSVRMVGQHGCLHQLKGEHKHRCAKCRPEDAVVAAKHLGGCFRCGTPG